MTTSRTLRGRLLALCFLVLGTDAVAVTRIMLTNDDGIASPGMQALFTAVSAIPDTEVKVIAPATDQSGTGSGVTIFAPLTLDSNAHLLNGIDAGIALGGKPADTVRFAVDRIYTDGVRPDLVISGINRGQNVGLAFGSGTVGAAQQASNLHIAAIACSLGLTFMPPVVTGGTVADYDLAAAFIARLVAGMVTHDPKLNFLADVLERKDMLNINFPPRDVQGVRITDPGDFDAVVRFHYADAPGGVVVPQVDLATVDTFNPAALAQGVGTDVGALAAGFITIVPFHNAGIAPPGRRGRCCSDLVP